MSTSLTLAVIVLAIVLGTVLVAEAAIRMVRQFRGIDEDVVARRLSRATEQQRATQVELFQPPRELPHLRDVFIPFYKYATKYLVQSGAPTTMNSVLTIAGCLSVAAFLALIVILPQRVAYLSLPLGVIIGCGSVFSYIMSLRSARIAAFEEQLPDAIDLIVRSLRVGHPLSVAVANVAQEMPSPIGGEFTTANNKITYGMPIPDAFKEMFERMPLPDLRFLVVAFQIQQESGGNLVESLTKLAAVIRDRFRMFRKVKAMTAEGRMSAWLLSLFPIGIGFVICLIKPGYYDNISHSPHFLLLASLTVVMLILNVVVMSFITKIRV